MKLLKTNIPFITILIFSLIGLMVSFILTIDTIELYKNTNFQLECNINSVIQCGNVIRSREAGILGFPNSIIGLVGYTVLVTISIYSLFVSKIEKKFSLLLLIGTFIAVLFSYFLLFISVFKIQALCPYCLTSCFSMTNIFFALLYYNLEENSFSLTERKLEKVQKFLQKGIYWPLIILWYAVVTSIILLELIK